MTIHWKFKPQILLRDGFVAFDSLQSEKATNTRIGVLGAATIWVRFTWVCFAHVFEIFKVMVSES